MMCYKFLFVVICFFNQKNKGMAHGFEVDLGRGFIVDLYNPVGKGKVAYKGYYPINEENKKSTVAKQVKLEGNDKNIHKHFRKILEAQCLAHENILQILSYFDPTTETYPTKNSLWIITEYWDPLIVYLKNVYKTRQKRLDEEDLLEIMEGCAKGVAFLHSRKQPVVHGNIHPANVHVQEEVGGGSRRLLVKIGDCLLTQLFGGRNLQEAPSTTSGKMVQKCYRPPEDDCSAPGHESYDVFSLGAVFHALLTHDREKTKNSMYLFPVIEGMKLLNRYSKFVRNTIFDTVPAAI